MAKVLIIGAAGLVGNYLVKTFEQHQHSYYAADINGNTSERIIQLDICQKDAVANCLRATKPDWIICPAAMPHVERCESDPELSYKINVVGISNVIEIATEQSAKFVFYSSAYVFDGVSGLYNEGDAPNPLSVYAQHKLLGEQRTLQANSQNLVLRTDGVFGLEKQPKNFVMAVVNRLKNGEPVRAPNDQSGNPTYAKWLADITIQLLEKEENGIFHACGSEALWRIDFARLIAKVFGFDPDLITECTTADLNQLALRPKHGTLAIDKLISTLDLKTDSLLNHLIELKTEIDLKNYLMQ